MAQDYAAAGHSVLADLVTRWDIHIYLHISTHIYTYLHIQVGRAVVGARHQPPGLRSPAGGRGRPLCGGLAGGGGPAAAAEPRHHARRQLHHRPAVPAHGGCQARARRVPSPSLLARLSSLSALMTNCLLSSYYTFDVSCWRRHIRDDVRHLSSFLGPLLSFAEAGLARGGSVLVHCLAGAHRAGTTGVICVMHFRGVL